MTREEWHESHRLSRLKKPALPGLGPLAAILKEHYGITLHGADAAKHYLIKKYHDQISDRLKLELIKLEEKGKLQAKAMWDDLFFKENPWLKMVPKDQYSGSYHPVPFELNDE